MLPTYSITPRGFEPVAQKQSCLPCRRKKKKCDGARPKCGLCRDSYGRDECLWPAARRGRKTRSIASDSSSSHKNETTEATASESPNQSDTSGSCDVITDELMKALPHINPDTIAEAYITFQRKVLCNHPAYKKSIMSLALPLAVQHEPLMNAWIASLLSHMSDDTAQWREESVIRYDRAVVGLKESVLVGSPSEEWKRSTALLCHAIELLQPVPSARLARSHLSAAHHMFQLTLDNPGVPASEHDALLFEAYILRTVSNVLVQQDIHKQLPFDYLESLVSMHQAGLDRLSQEMTPQNCPWMSGMGPELLILTYKTSWICIQDPIPELRRPEAVEVWRSLDRMGEIQQHEWPDQNYDYTNARRVYRLACRVLLKPFVFDSDSGCPASDVDAFVSLGLQELECLSQDSRDDMIMIWPLLVFGALSTNERQKAACTRIAAQLQQKVVIHPIKAVLSFLGDIWEAKDNTTCFRDSEALRSILL